MHLLLVALGALLVPADETARKELDAFQGIWKSTSVEKAGRPLGGPFATAYVLLVSGNEISYSSQVGVFIVDPTKRTLDVTYETISGKADTQLAIYELADGKLKLAISDDSLIRIHKRPQKFETDQDTAHFLYTFERDNTVTKEQVASRLKERKEKMAAATAAWRASDPVYQLQLQMKQVLEKLDRMEKRLDALDKKIGITDKK